MDFGTTDASAAGDASQDVAATVPTVTANFPLHSATHVARTVSVTATFNEAMDGASFGTTSVTLT